MASQQQEPSVQSSRNGAGFPRIGLRFPKSFDKGYVDIYCIERIIQIGMSFEEKLQTIFREAFQVKRVSKQVQTLKQAKQKLGLETRFTLTRGCHLSIFVEILPLKLKELKKISTLKKLQFKIVLKATYPTEVPRVYFLLEDSIELGLNPFHDYLVSVISEWTPKITIIDIIKNVPAFLVKCMERTGPILGNPLLYEYFEVERLFSYHHIQNFPVKLVRNGQLFLGMFAIVNQIEVILFEQTRFQSSYSIADFIALLEIQSVQKHKTKPICVMIQIKRGGSRFGVEFYSQDYENIISSLSEAMKQTTNIPSKAQQHQSSDEETQYIMKQKNVPSSELVITETNLTQVQSQMTILQSLVESTPNSKNIKELVELLKKAVEYFSMKGDLRCQMYLKQLQDIMGNEFMQALLESQAPPLSKSASKENYQTIADFV